MNGDRRPKMSKLMRDVKFKFDCMMLRKRIKGIQKRRQRKLARRGRAPRYDDLYYEGVQWLEDNR